MAIARSWCLQHRQDLIARLKAAKKRPAPKAAAEPAAKRGAVLVFEEKRPQNLDHLRSI